MPTRASLPPLLERWVPSPLVGEGQDGGRVPSPLVGEGQDGGGNLYAAPYS